MWSLGALLELDDRVKMEEFMLGHESHLNYPQIEQGSGHTIFEFVVNSQGIPWFPFIPCAQIACQPNVLLCCLQPTSTNLKYQTKFPINDEECRLRPVMRG